MDTLLLILAIAAGLVGIVGSILPGLPGPPVSWLGLLLMYWRGGLNPAGDPMTLKFLLLWLGITIGVTILDYTVPAWFTRVTGGSRYAGRGAIAGMIAGLIFPPVGILLGTFLGAFLAELLFAQKDGVTSITAALGAFLGFLFGTGLKLAASGVMLWYIFVYI